MATTYKLSDYVRALRRAIADDDDAGYKHLVEDFLIDDKGAYLVGRKPEFYSCGICCCYHPAQWDGDCREDGNRFAIDELDEKYGAQGWEEVDVP